MSNSTTPWKCTVTLLALLWLVVMGWNAWQAECRGFEYDELTLPAADRFERREPDRLWIYLNGFIHWPMFQLQDESSSVGVLMVTKGCR